MPQPTSITDPTGTIPALVDGNPQTGQHSALRTSLRPMDFGQPFQSYGSYSYSGITGTTAAGLGAIFIAAFRWTDPSRYALIRRVRGHQSWIATTFTAGACTLEMLVARAYTAADATGGTAQTITGNVGKRRSSMGSTQVSSIYLATTGAISGGTRVTDAHPIACVTQAVQATAGATMIQGSQGNLFDPSEEGRYPLVLAANEGFLVRSTAPATGTYATRIDIDWDEVAAF